MRTLLLIGVLILLWQPPATLAVQAGDDAESVARQRAIAWLHTQQLPDGGFGDPPDRREARSNAGVTADVVYTLARLGEKPDGPAWSAGGRTAVDALEALGRAYAEADPGQAGKVARAVALAGGNVRSFAGVDLVRTIERFYDPTSGRFHPQLQFRHTLALEGLALAGAPVPSLALDALLSARLPAGEWFWAFEGTQGDVDSTGRIMQVLAEHGGLRCAPALLVSGDYLVAQATPEGWGVGYPPGPPNANSTALVVSALRAAGYDPTNARYGAGGRSPLHILLDFQQADGSFVYMREPGREESRLMATLDALNALAEPATSEDSCSLFYLPAPLHR